MLPRDLQILQGSLKSAIHQCQQCEQREVRIPQVQFARGRFYLLLGEAYQATGRTPPTYTDPAVAAGLTIIQALHLNELRTAVRALQ